MKNRQFSTRIGSSRILSSPLLLARLGSSRILSSMVLSFSQLLSSPLRTSWLLSAPLGFSCIRLSPLGSSLLNSAPLRPAFIRSSLLLSTPLLSALLRSSPLWGEEKIRYVGFSTLCTYIKKLTTSDTNLLLPRQMNLVLGNCLISNYVRIQFFLYGSQSTLKNIIVL